MAAGTLVNTYLLSYVCNRSASPLNLRLDFLDNASSPAALYRSEKVAEDIGRSRKPRVDLDRISAQSSDSMNKFVRQNLSTAPEVSPRTAPRASGRKPQ